MKAAKVRVLLVVVALVLLLGHTREASAGPYGDTLGKCLVSSTTAKQKETLVRWMFAMMALHPAVERSSAVTPAERTLLSKETAQLFQQLLTESCRAQATEAIKYEGPGTMEASFSLLGQVAARELFAHPRVDEGLSEFAKFLDENELKRLTDATASP